MTGDIKIEKDSSDEDQRTGILIAVIAIPLGLVGAEFLHFVFSNIIILVLGFIIITAAAAAAVNHLLKKTF